jgi:hypothetical protein
MQEKNKILIECSDKINPIKAEIIEQGETYIQVEFPSGFQMTLTRKLHSGYYACQMGLLEFASTGKTVK